MFLTLFIVIAASRPVKC